VPISYLFIQGVSKRAVRNTTLNKQMQDALAKLGPRREAGCSPGCDFFSGEPDQAVMDIFGFNEPDGPLAIVETTEDRLMLR
jgi:hypothetical protein